MCYVSSIFVGGNDIFEVMVRLNLFYLAVLVLGLNIWTTNDNALYTAGLGLANIFHPVSYTHLDVYKRQVQYSPLLPPVGVWAVSQSQCGRSLSQAGY